LVPDTVFISGGVLSNWYFTSKKQNLVLRKKQHRLSTFELFKALYRQSSASAQEDFDDRKINEYLKKEESSDEENVSFNAQQSAPEFQRKSSLTKASAAQLMTQQMLYAS